MPVQPDVAWRSRVWGLQASAAEAGLSVVQERVAQERQQPKLADLTPEEEFSARLDHALSTLKLEVKSVSVTSNGHFLAALQMPNLW